MELYSLNLEEGSNLHHHINSFNQLVCQLANVDDAIKDEEQALRCVINEENDGDMIVPRRSDKVLLERWTWKSLEISNTIEAYFVGSVSFKLHDGSVKTALNVKYVPGAARNILSLGVLTSRGYRYVGRKDTCKEDLLGGVIKGKKKIERKECAFSVKMTVSRDFEVKGGFYSVL
ncbi:hypothetical protein Tco_0610075 [Tanacetum coccineum]